MVTSVLFNILEQKKELPPARRMLAEERVLKAPRKRTLMTEEKGKTGNHLLPREVAHQ